jgi:hypothetical protein
MFDGKIVPVINIYFSKINKEGYRNGNLADHGIENWRNIFKIRKAFFEHVYCRFEMV